MAFIVVWMKASLLKRNRLASSSSRPNDFTMRIPASVSCSVEAMSPMRSWPRVARFLNRFPILAMVTTESGTTIIETAASFQFW